MTRFACIADIHDGAGADHRQDALADTEDALGRFVDACRDREVDTVLIAGDLFHRPKPTPQEMHVFARFACRLEDAGIPAIAIHGNCGHDLVNGDLPSALELFRSDWMRVSRVPEMIRAAGDVAVCTLPSVPVSRLVAARGGGDRAEINDEAADLLVGEAARLRAEVPDGWPCVLLGHWSVTGAALPSGLPVDALHEPVLPMAALDALGFDAVVLGHIHKPQMVGDGLGFYCGSPMCHDFGEADVEHGFWIVETALSEGEDRSRPLPGVTADDLSSGRGLSQSPSLSVEFVPLADRRFITVNVDLTSIRSEATGEEAARTAPDADPTSIETTATSLLCSADASQFNGTDVNLTETLTESGTQAGVPGVADREAVVNPPQSAGDLGSLAREFESRRRPEVSDSVSVLDETDTIIEEILAKGDLTDAVVRVSYRATEKQHRRVDQAEILRLLEDEGVHRVYGGIRWEPVSVSRARVAGVDETLSPLEAVAAWCAANDREHADALAGLARELLEATA